MWLHKITEHHFLLLHLLIAGFTCATTIEVSEVTREKKVSFDDTSTQNQYSVREATTLDSIASLEPIISSSNEKLTSPIIIEARNNSNIFKPSVHLGEIEQPNFRTNPFNNVQHVRFENNVQLDAQHDRFQDIFQDTYQDVSSLLDETTRPSRIKFQDDSSMIPKLSIHQSFDDQQIVTESSRSQDEVATIYIDQAFFQNVKKPEIQDTSSTIFGKAKTDHQLIGTYLDASKSPYVISYHTNQHQNAYQPILQETTFKMVKKPDSNGVLVLQQHESTYTRKRKFPYQFYQPDSKNHDLQFAEGPQYSTYPQMRRLFPWKKIIHLIGTILPLGLLLATLTPNVVQINNTTANPNIVLSKLRVADLPLEHKRARLLNDQSAACEDRSICELILAGGESQSTILQNILWSLAVRTPDDIAKSNGLREVFNAAKKKDCATINC